MTIASDMYDVLSNYPCINLSRESQILLGLCVVCELLVKQKILSEEDIQEVIYKARTGEV
jgi:hypothetical protein